jgi:hypothetical protein
MEAVLLERTIRSRAVYELEGVFSLFSGGSMLRALMA